MMMMILHVMHRFTMVFSWMQGFNIVSLHKSICQLSVYTGNNRAFAFG